MAYLIKFKTISQKKDLKQAGMKGLAQIRERAYPVAIHNAGVSPEQVRTMAIIVQGKRVMVMEEGQEGSSQ